MMCITITSKDLNMVVCDGIITFMKMKQVGDIVPTIDDSEDLGDSRDVVLGMMKNMGNAKSSTVMPDGLDMFPGFPPAKKNNTT